MVVRQLFVVEAQQVQDRGVQVVHVHRVLGSAEPDRICLAVADTAFDTATGN